MGFVVTISAPPPIQNFLKIANAFLGSFFFPFKNNCEKITFPMCNSINFRMHDLTSYKYSNIESKPVVIAGIAYFFFKLNLRISLEKNERLRKVS